MIGCPADGLLSDYLLGRISADDLDSVSEHLSTCRKCEERLTGLDAATAPVLAPLGIAPIATDVAYAAAVQVLLQNDPAGPRPRVQVGSVLREYELLEKIGEGGMGTVYRALHARLDKIVAVKVLRRGPWGDLTSASRVVGTIDYMTPRTEGERSHRGFPSGRLRARLHALVPAHRQAADGGGRARGRAAAGEPRGRGVAVGSWPSATITVGSRPTPRTGRDPWG